MNGRTWAAAIVVAAVALWAALPAGVLGLPFYWDAVAVYAPGAKWLAEHGFDLRPGVFPADLSKGHPALFFLLAGAAFRAFGATPLVGHALSAVMSVLTLALTFATGAAAGSRLAGALAAALLLGSPLYLSMSAQLLPEVTLCALVMACLYSYLRDRMGCVALFGALLVLCKETGLACPLAIGGAILLGGERPRARRLLLAAVPVSALAAFFLWQWAREGWIFMPSQAALVSGRALRWQNAGEVAISLLVRDGRWVPAACALPAAIVIRPWREPARRKLYLAGGLLGAAFLTFFTKSFWLLRYGLPAHAPLCLMITLPIVLAARRLSDRRLAVTAACVPVALAVVLGLARRSAGSEVASGEETFRYADVIASRRALYRILEQRPGDPLIVTDWPMDEELASPWLGWVARPFHAISLDGLRRRGPTRVDAIVVLDRACHDRELRAAATARGLRLAHRTDVHGAVHELWSAP